MPTTDRKSAIVLNVDGLRTGMLGPYGNTWFDTPSFNRLAADSTVYHQCIAQTPNLERAYQSMWTGQHPAVLAAGGQREPAALPPWPEDSLFLTDRPDLPMAGIETVFDRVVQVGLPQTAAELVDSVEATTLARFFAESIDWIRNQPDASLFWLDCQGMFGNWDAPYSFRASAVDADDPDAPTLCQPPVGRFHEDSDDPDQLLGYQQAYAGQVMLLDQCLGVLLEELESLGRLQQTLVCVYASRGYPLGEHGVVGSDGSLLNSESIHVPLMIRWPHPHLAAIRNHQLVHPGMLPGVLQAWLAGDPEDRDSPGQFHLPRNLSAPSPHRKTELIFSVGHSPDHPIEAIQTHAWKLIRGNGKQLFVRPDDVWEVNDVHSRCFDVTTSLEALLDSGAERLMEGGSFLDQPLADALAWGFE